MTWSYSGDPSKSDLDSVRFWLQDTQQDRPLLTDEELIYLLDLWMPKYNSLVLVAAFAAEVIAAKFTGEVSVSADGVSVQVGELQQRYQQLAQRLREQYKADAVDVDLIDDVMWDQAVDSSIDPLVFGVGFMDNYEVGRADYGNYSPGDHQYQLGSAQDEELTGGV